MTDPRNQKIASFDEEPEMEAALRREQPLQDEACGGEELLAGLVGEEEEADRNKFMGAGAAASPASAVEKVKVGPSRKTWTDMKYSPNLKSGAIVNVVYAWTSIDFQVICVADAEPLLLLQEELFQRFHSGPKKVHRKPERDDVVVAEYEGHYYRARVAHSTSKMCQVYFIDQGDKSTKMNEKIYEIPEDLYRTPVYGLKVRLDGFDATNVNVKPVFSDTVETELYETPYTLELTKKLDDGHTRGILRNVSNNKKTVNDILKGFLLKH